MAARSGLLHLASGIVLLAGLLTFDSRAAAEPIEAVWKVQKLTFEYRGDSTFYSCGGLRQKLEAILTRLGAHESLRLNGFACNDRFGTPTFQIILASPVLATEENLRTLTTYTSEQELVARARGERLPRAEDLQRFPAHWETVSFSRDRRMRIEPGDCELVRQLSRAILPYLTVRIVEDRLFCTSFGSLHRPRLIVAALVPAPAQ
jgi:hypothetical protein